MTQAWEQRKAEQDQLLRELMANANDTIGADGDRDTFFMSLSMELLGALIAERLIERDGEIPPYLALTTNEQLIVEHCFIAKTRIHKFTRTPEEERHLIAALAVKFAEAGFSDINGDYQRQLFTDPS